jgi:hypothetical protein
MKVKYLVICIALIAVGCERSLTKEDHVAFSAITNGFPGKYRVLPTGDIYLKIIPESTNLISRLEAIIVSKMFFLQSIGTNSSTKIVYLNFYSKEGVFLFQTFLDPKTSDISFSHREGY